MSERLLLVFIAIFLLGGPGLAQEEQPLICTSRTQIELTLAVSNDSLILRQKIIDGTLNYLTSIDLQLRETDLHIKGQTARQIKDFYYEISVQIETRQGHVIRPQVRHLIGDSRFRTGSSPALVWQDFMELGLPLDQPFSLIMQTALHGELDINCAGSPPSRPLDNPLAKRVYLAAGVAGVGLGVFSLTQRRAAEKSYEIYQQGWKDSHQEGTVSNDLQNAENKKASYESVGIIGVSILALTGLIYADNFRKYLRNKKRYEKYCCGATAIQQSTRISFTPDLSYAGLGMSMKINF